MCVHAWEHVVCCVCFARGMLLNWDELESAMGGSALSLRSASPSRSGWRNSLLSPTHSMSTGTVCLEGRVT